LVGVSFSEDFSFLKDDLTLETRPLWCRLVQDRVGENCFSVFREFRGNGLPPAFPVSREAPDTRVPFNCLPEDPDFLSCFEGVYD